MLKILFPKRIGSQIALLIVTSVVVASVVTAAIITLQRPPRPLSPIGILANLAFTAKLLDASAGPEDRAKVLKNAREGITDLVVLDTPPPQSDLLDDIRPVQDLKLVLGSRYEAFVFRPRHGGSQQEPRVAVRLPDGSSIAANLPPPPSEFPAVLWVGLFLAVVLVSLFLWVARALTAPLAYFAEAAGRFSGNRSDTPLAECGPTEVRELACALNDMRDRIRSMVEDRTRMLAAIGHDLRTPITRLRLRAEDIEPVVLRHQVIRDLDSMQHMVQSALSFLRERSINQNTHLRVDLPSVVQVLCDEFADMGRHFVCEAPAHLYVDCDSDQITRALVNLLDNALKFGTTVRLAVTQSDKEVFIDVEDDGPGVPETLRGKLTEPFYRGDEARGLGEQASFGLGLSIVQSIADAHHGRLEFHEVTPHGLRVRLVLPRARLTPATTGAAIDPAQGGVTV